MSQQARWRRARIDDDWAIQDLLFRLHMLRLRHPAYIDWAMVDAWGSGAQTKWLRGQLSAM